MRKNFIKILCCGVILCAAVGTVALGVNRHRENLTSATASATAEEVQVVISTPAPAAVGEHQVVATNSTTPAVVHDAGGVAKFQPHGSKAPVVPPNPYLGQKN